MTHRTHLLLLILSVTTIITVVGCKKTNKGTVTTIDRSQNGTYQEGPWAYILSINTGSSNNQGVVGNLYYQGILVPIPDNIGDYYETSLGQFKYVGITPGTKQNPILPWDDQGWIPLKSKEKPKGKKIPITTLTTNVETEEVIQETDESEPTDDPNETTEEM